ncbi:bifunctional folylpolyglutamate synthase/dihydrofolate synthase, partial [Candidatus Bipolaricaulota bacterium]|nr:bifunctional folylpolyglutamate synthase/dihydrofolate synthase [Candidatus Bipolaricaulota bacterium]
QPQLAHPTIHVGGTNGTGSVVAMLDAVLRAAGFSVGRFTSPELIDFRDRIAVNGEWISEEDLAAAVERMAPMIDALDDAPSQFEIIAALAFDYLARSNVDISVIEVGLGGRFDATNVIHPELAILTNVTLDHQAILGDTVEAIAWEKAGIAKPGVPLLTAGLPESVLAIVRAECDVVGARLTCADDIAVTRISRDWDAAAYEVDWGSGVRNVSLPLIGSVQRENMKLVLGAVRELRVRGFTIPDSAVIEGLQTVCWPGRLEVVRKHPTILLDGAHNEAAIRSLVADVRDLVPDPKHRFLLYGALADKDVDVALSALRTVFPSIGLCTSDSPRALPMGRLAEKAEGPFQQITQYNTIAEGIESWLVDASVDDVLVITGSLTVVGAARRWLMEGM